MQTKAFATILVACVVVIAPIRAWASPVEVFTLEGVSYSSPSGTLSGTFDYDGTNFSNIAITATGGYVDGDLFNINNGSSATSLNALASNDDSLVLNFASPLPSSGGGTDDVNGGYVFSEAEFDAGVAFFGGGYDGFLICEFEAFCGSEGIAVAGDVTTVTPLPAALPLFVAGLGSLGLLGWRRERKNAAAIAAA